MNARVRNTEPRITYFAKFRRRSFTRARITPVNTRIITKYTRAFVGSCGSWNAGSWNAEKMPDRRIAATWVPRSVAPIATIAPCSRSMGRLLQRQAPEGHGTRDLLDQHLDDGALRRAGDVDHILVELRDPVALLPDVLDHELVDLALHEGGLLDLRGLLHGLHGSARAAGIAFEHRDAVLLHEPCVGPAALLAQ